MFFICIYAQRALNNQGFWSSRTFREEKFYNHSILIISEDFKISITQILIKRTVLQSSLHIYLSHNRIEKIQVKNHDQA